MNTVYIALGANLGDPVETLAEVVQQFKTMPEFERVACSSFYRSAPMGPQDQPDYVNAVLRAHTPLAPLALLDLLQSLEDEFGRVRSRRWGARTLDLDLLLFADLSLQHPRLTVPHPGLAERDFVVVPLHELAPRLRLPDGRQVAALFDTMSNHDLVKIT